jgi:hypothetical protein
LTEGDDKEVFDVTVSEGGANAVSAKATLRVGPFPTTYMTIKGEKMNLYAWPGTKTAILTRSNELDPATMRLTVRSSGRIRFG